MSEKRFSYFKVPLGFGKQAIKDNANDEVFDFTLSNVLDKLNDQQATITALKEENSKLRNIHLSIDLTYSYGYGRYLADVRVIDDE